MKLVDMSIKGFSGVLASDAPAPGGGSTAALEGVLGAALIRMVASLTIGRAKYAQSEQTMIQCARQAEDLRLRLLDIIDRDTDAFNKVSAVFDMPKETEVEKNKRSAAMQAALKACTLPPYEIMECAHHALETASGMRGKYNESAASDLGVAVLSLKTAMQGAWLNILINLGGIKDVEFVTEYKHKGEAILKAALPLADTLYEDVLLGCCGSPRD